MNRVERQEFLSERRAKGGSKHRDGAPASCEKEGKGATGSAGPIGEKPPIHSANEITSQNTCLVE